MTAAFVHGFILSLGLILPVGMQNGFILTQGALHRRWSAALPAVLTASLCDTMLIALAVFGVSAAALHLVWVRYTLGLVGIVFLLFMGWSTWRETSSGKSAASDAALSVWTAKRQVGFAASVSLLNPHALIDTLAVIGGSASAYPSWAEKGMFGLACTAVSWIWFFGLSMVGHLVGRAALSAALLHWLNRVSAVMMWASAVYLAYIIYSLR